MNKKYSDRPCFDLPLEPGDKVIVTSGKYKNLIGEIGEHCKKIEPVDDNELPLTYWIEGHKESLKKISPLEGKVIKESRTVDERFINNIGKKIDNFLTNDLKKIGIVLGTLTVFNIMLNFVLSGLFGNICYLIMLIIYFIFVINILVPLRTWRRGKIVKLMVEWVGSYV